MYIAYNQIRLLTFLTGRNRLAGTIQYASCVYEQTEILILEVCKYIIVNFIFNSFFSTIQYTHPVPQGQSKWCDRHRSQTRRCD